MQEADGWDYCRKCCKSFTQDPESPRLPPCAQRPDGLCTFGNAQGQLPIYLRPDDRLAWNLYREVITLSPPDANGLPTLTLLSDSLKWVESWMHSDAVFELVDKIRTVHATVMEWRIAEIKSRANSK